MLGKVGYHRLYGDAVRFTDRMSDSFEFLLATRSEKKVVAAACEAIGVPIPSDAPVTTAVPIDVLRSAMISYSDIGCLKVVLRPRCALR